MTEKMQKPDSLNEIGVLKRREIEARIVSPLLEALGERFGRDEVLEVAREVIVQIATQQGAELAEMMGGNSMGDFVAAQSNWTKGDALATEILEQNDEEFNFNVTRCRYAEMYQALGIPELGAVMSCNRDFMLMQGFNPDIELTRTQTIMEGAAYCDFRFRKRADGKET